MKNTGFIFKTFRLINENTAIKVNTDGVLLGAWADFTHSKRVLDIGTGGGVIAFIARHKNPKCTITGIDIDHTSIHEAQINLGINKSSDIKFYHTSIQNYSLNTSFKFDTIISNPPFFKEKQETLLERNLRKRTAKHQTHLSASDLLKHSSKLLDTNGHFYCIYPYTLKSEILTLFKKYSLGIKRIMNIRGKTSGPLTRVMIHGINQKVNVTDESEIAIRAVEDNEVSFTKEYMKLTKDFYLNF